MLHVHLCKMETLREAYQMAKKNDGAPGTDGVTFETIEASGAEGFLNQDPEQLVSRTYQPSGCGRRNVSERMGAGTSESCRFLVSATAWSRELSSYVMEPDFRSRLPTGVIWIPASNGKRLRRRPPGSQGNRENKSTSFASSWTSNLLIMFSIRCCSTK